MTQYICDNSTYEDKIKELLSPEGINAVWNKESNEITYVTKKIKISNEMIQTNEKQSFVKDFVTNGHLDKQKMSILQPIYIKDLKICIDLANNQGYVPSLKEIN
jgi:hypothetical protein